MFSSTRLLLKRWRLSSLSSFNSKNMSLGSSNVGIDLSKYTKCRAISASDISPTIRALKLEVIDKGQINSLSFKPGQWVDFYVQSLQKMSGYSITSLPEELENNNFISLAIKKSDEVIAAFLHSDTDKVLKSSFYLRVGGNFHVSATDEAKHYFLICGGIGITPFCSIFKYFCKYAEKSRVTLLYSASSPKEFALLDELRESQQCAPNRSQIVLTVTRRDNEQKEDEWDGRIGRIDVEMIEKYKNEQSKEFDEKKCEYLICGPAQMIDELNQKLQAQMNVNPKQIHFEKWW